MPAVTVTGLLLSARPRRAGQVVSGIEVVANAADGEETLALATDRQPDVVLMDLHIPRCVGEEVTSGQAVIAHGVNSCTGPSPPILARSSALGSPSSSPDADPVAMIASIRWARFSPWQGRGV